MDRNITILIRRNGEPNVTEIRKRNCGREAVLKHCETRSRGLLHARNRRYPAVEPPTMRRCITDGAQRKDLGPELTGYSSVEMAQWRGSTRDELQEIG